MNKMVAAALLAGAMANPAAAQSGTTPFAQFEPTPDSAHDMSFWVGTWHITEVIYPGRDNEYVEVSVRTCDWSVNRTYVTCRIHGSARGRQRESLWLINQPEEGHLEILGVFSNIPVKSLYRGEFLPDGSGLDMQNFEITEDALVAGTRQRLRFVSPDEFEWHIGIRNAGTPEETVIGIERAIRVTPRLGGQ
jgi:hypothetical protein